ncbi:uncharacterized protein B0T15DRAFT_121747 [Chaetomium strumarium]|uniref:LPXTG-domain-containing protein n=1 Tax=Chaetomium strumarium TaxID=1170767 RepID=A0AAJ0GZ89_9PEZI|nr:hypothetical protein B0T15DRAFT_121747 [Chaetomium strumarium]
MAPYQWIPRSSLFTLLALCSVPRLSSALQVTPNSPCSSVCRDSLDLDTSDPNSSNTKNSDISCQDADYSTAAGTKFKDCMTCLQSSTFSQGSESDTKWFLYNLRYTAAYCVFGYPNATDVGSTPCSTSRACGNLQASVEHGIPSPGNTTAYSYCSAGGSAALDSANFDMCIPCLSAMGTTEYLANYFVALQAGCLQQPAPGAVLGLNDTIFSDTQIGIVDPKTLDDDRDSKPSLATPVIIGIAVGAVAFLLLVAAISFVCVRRRRNRHTRASAETEFYSGINRRHHSSMSFQCQTHMVSPRFWPGAEEGVSTPAAYSPDGPVQRSSMWKPHDPNFLYNQGENTPHDSRKATMAGLPLQISTSMPPAAPPQAYASPSSGGGSYHDYRSPLSAESVRSTSALFPPVKPYIPAEHGVHVQAGSPTSATTEIGTGIIPDNTGMTGMTPLLKSHGWPLPDQKKQEQAEKRIIRLSNPNAVPPPPPPPPLKTKRSSGMLGRKSPKNLGQGSPVESWEIQTAFPAPPKR